jgi:hypothetical protein
LFGIDRDNKMSGTSWNYYLELWGVDPVFSFSATVPRAYSMRKLAKGTADPTTGAGSFVLDDNIFQRTTGTSSIGGGIGTVTFVTGRDALLIQSVLSTTGPILPSAYSDSTGCLYIPAPTVPLWLQALFEAIGPLALGIAKSVPAASGYYQPANTTMQLSDPSLLPRVQQILVYNGPVAGTYLTYMLYAHNLTAFSLKATENT